MTYNDGGRNNGGMDEVYRRMVVANDYAGVAAKKRDVARWLSGDPKNVEFLIVHGGISSLVDLLYDEVAAGGGGKFKVTADFYDGPQFRGGRRDLFGYFVTNNAMVEVQK
jgi:hypothetical protein